MERLRRVRFRSLEKRLLQYSVGQNLLDDGIPDRTTTDIIRAAVKSAPDALHLFGPPGIRLIGQLPNPLKFFRLGGNSNFILTNRSACGRLSTA